MVKTKKEEKKERLRREEMKGIELTRKEKIVMTDSMTEIFVTEIS